MTNQGPNLRFDAIGLKAILDIEAATRVPEPVERRAATMSNNYVGWFRDPVVFGFTMNLHEHPPTERQENLASVVQVYQRFLLERFPPGQGYRHSRKETTPYRDQGYKHVAGYSLRVHRGLFWGYAIDVYPLHPGIDQARTSVCFDMLLVSRCWLCSLILGLLSAVFLTIVFVTEGGMRRGDAWLVGLFTVAVVFAAMLVFWLIARLLEKAHCPSPEAIAEEMAALHRDLMALAANPYAGVQSHG